MKCQHCSNSSGTSKHAGKNQDSKNPKEIVTELCEMSVHFPRLFSLVGLLQAISMDGVRKYNANNTNQLPLLHL